MSGLNDHKVVSQDESLEKVVERAKAGDTEAFHTIYRLYVRRLFSFAHHMLNNRAEAEEVVQEVFILVFRKLKTLSENQKLESWIFRITRNLIYMRYRHRPYQPISLETEEELEEELESLTDQRASPEERILELERQKAARQAIASLPEKMRDAFILSIFQNYPYQKIAEITGKSVAAVKSDIHRARLLVRESIRSTGRGSGQNDEMPFV